MKNDQKTVNVSQLAASETLLFSLWQCVLKRHINPVFFGSIMRCWRKSIPWIIWERLAGNTIYRDDEKIILLPEQIPLISYPYEWSFSQYKHAAQLTLRLQMFLLGRIHAQRRYAFNILSQRQVLFIDTLSIERYTEMNWRAFYT
jgi:hypothetical protein